MKEFYILWHPDGRTPPTVRFDTIEAAMEVAETMMARIGAGTMHIMKSVGGLTIEKKYSWEAINNGEPRQLDNSEANQDRAKGRAKGRKARN